MSNTTTIPDVTPITAPAEPLLPELDPTIGDGLGDEILLGAARDTKVARVKVPHGRPVGSRAWTMGGNVD